MRNFLVPAAIAAILVSTPAAAHQDRWYVGGDIGVVLPRDTELDITDVTTDTDFNNVFDIQHDTGYELDAVVGFDFGMLKTEGELSFKHAGFDALDPSQEWIDFLEDQLTGVIVDPSDIELENGMDIISVMGNGFVDFGPDDGFGGYVGGGVGYGWAKAYGETDGSFAWQLVAGARYPVSADVDVGIKYKYFDMSSLDYISGVDVEGTIFQTDIGGNWRSHSVLLNFTYNL